MLNDVSRIIDAHTLINSLLCPYINSRLNFQANNSTSDTPPLFDHYYYYMYSFIKLFTALAENCFCIDSIVCAEWAFENLPPFRNHLRLRF